MSKQQIKLALLTLEYPPQVGGVGNYYAGLAKHWGGNDIKVYSTKLQWKLWPKWLPSIWQTWKLIKNDKPEFLGVGQILPLGYVALLFKRRKKIPFIVFTHGLDILLPQASRWKKKWLNKILKAASVIVANSQFTKGQLLKIGVDENKIILVYPGVELGHIVSKEQLDELKNKHKLENKKIILSVGRLVKRKGFDKVIDVLPKILRRIPNALYVIIGRGVGEDGLKARSASYGLNKDILFLNNVSDSERDAWYQLANVFALPCEQIGSDVEGLGMVFLEAALAGKPVIVGNSGGAPETIRHGYSGFVINPDSEDELYQALIKILSDEEFANRLGRYGRDWVIKNFNWSNEIKKLKNKVCP